MMTMSDSKLFASDPREFALELVENGLVTADHLLLCALKYMSHDDVREMLDANELSPRFDEDDEDDENAALENWLYILDDGDHDIEAIRVDFSNGNIEIDAQPERVDEYRHENIIRASIVNGNFTQANEQCIRYGYDFDEMRRLHG
jgi:hypothetical protein